MQPPRQARSQATLERILTATGRLLDGRDNHSIPVSEILVAADVSASSFYARFPNKGHLLEALHTRFVEQARKLLDVVALRERTAQRAPVEVLREATRLYIVFQTSHFGPARSFQSAEASDEVFAERRRALETYAIHLVRDYLCDHLPCGRDVEVARRIELATWALAVAVTGAVRPPYAFANLVGLDHDRLVDEVTTMMWAYLREVTSRDHSPRL